MTAIYDEQFYRSITGQARSSAREVLPLIQALLQPQSVIDIGCGVGSWLSVWRELGVDDVLGVDGDYVTRSQLEIPHDQFFSFDLNQPLPFTRQFDLVMSLEVAEHLPSEQAAEFVSTLSQLGSVVLFSAAIPHQGGTHHVNEQWPDYWVRLFAEHGFVPIDFLRPRIWQNERVEWYYAQNLLLFVAGNFLAEHQDWQVAYKNAAQPPPALVHPHKYLEVIEWNAKVQQTLLELGTLIPLEDKFLLVDEDQFGGLLRALRRAIPFSEQDGYYNGTPIDSAAALLEFQRQYEAGTQWIVFAWPAFWWLDYYQEFTDYLRENFRCVAENERVVVFNLRKTDK